MSNQSFLFLPTPKKISYFYKLGSLLGLFLVIQMVSGIILTFFFNSLSPFDAVDFIMRDVTNGWLVRFIHCTGASFYFFFIYIHMFRGLYYNSYIRNHHAWSAGCSIYIMSMAIAFLGYVLPWGKMSFWGATVITNLFSTIPWFGKNFVIMLWGDFSVNLIIVSRFFSLHFLLPFILIVFIILHIYFLHSTGSSNPLNMNSDGDKVSFTSFFVIKDLWVFFLILSMFFFFIGSQCYSLLDPNNFIVANPLLTPPHIEPEWYFLAVYAMLRSIPSKLGGVIALISSILILFLLPYLHKKKESKKMINRTLIFFFLFVFIVLTWKGHVVVEYPYQFLGSLFTFFYFSYFTFMIMNSWNLK